MNHTLVIFSTFLNTVNDESDRAAVSFGPVNIFTAMCVLAMLR